MKYKKQKKAPFKCSVCGRQFDKQRGLDVHVARMHGPKAVSKKRAESPPPQKGPDSNVMFVTVPGELGGIPFSVDITMNLVATAIKPLQE